MAGAERSAAAPAAQQQQGGGFMDSLLGQMCCCASDNQHSLGILDMQGALTSPEFFLKDFAINDRGPDQIEEAEKVDNDLTKGMQSGGSSGGNPLRLQLLAAVRNDDAPGVLQHVADGADISLMGEALRLASHRGSASVVRELVAVGLSVNDNCPQTHFTPIHLAAAGGHHVVCEVLLDALADVHRPIGGTTALSMARKSGHAEVEEVITRHITSLVMNDQGADNSQANRRAHVLPRVSPFLSEAVLQALPAPPGHDKENGTSPGNGAPQALEAASSPAKTFVENHPGGARESPQSVDNSGAPSAQAPPPVSPGPEGGKAEEATDGAKAPDGQPQVCESL
eukprot:TRINITY_DN39386_c0_g1_i1.p1 TRINITY_DN39386_c0_g1~~TRINITY_DN39386_c0_g1_i1.p1  ORF type:complete len:340 (+),score=60.90 TRINITY_DN39386_c0_g1_i1:59-1078(+)